MTISFGPKTLFPRFCGPGAQDIRLPWVNECEGTRNGAKGTTVFSSDIVSHTLETGSKCDEDLNSYVGMRIGDVGRFRRNSPGSRPGGSPASVCPPFGWPRWSSNRTAEPSPHVHRDAQRTESSSSVPRNGLNAPLGQSWGHQGRKTPTADSWWRASLGEHWLHQRRNARTNAIRRHRRLSPLGQYR